MVVWSLFLDMGVVMYYIGKEWCRFIHHHHNRYDIRNLMINTKFLYRCAVWCDEAGRFEDGIFREAWYFWQDNIWEL